jgi:plastocyanin
MTLTRRRLAILAAAMPLAALVARPARAASHQVLIKGMKFDPRELTVAAGDSVTFLNEDNAPHTATARDGSFDTGRLAKGESAEVSFGRAGSFDYFCAVHPMMKATITVA